MVSSDYASDAVEQFQWCFAEVNAGIVCACAPALKPFFVRYLPGLLSSHFRSHNREDEVSKQNEAAGSGSQGQVRDQAREDLYELQWRDDVSEVTATTKRSGNDDEMRLWEGTSGEVRFQDVRTAGSAH
jgi:hypothetical protein